MTKRTTAGLVLFVAAVAIMFAPQLGYDIPLARQLTILLGAFVIGAGYLYGRGESRTDTNIPDIEGPTALPTPGDEIENQLEILSDTRSGRTKSAGGERHTTTFRSGYTRWPWRRCPSDTT
ncbi:DUF7269 family protein [Halovenus salina]|uniref:Uncharacterized protein n=1 Tax=Halovenus salina TaxID=1510225 RepID=A0ABD5W9R1_9EURY